MYGMVQGIKDSGYYIILIDYLTDSLDKKVTDESWMLGINDVEGIKILYHRNPVDDILNDCRDHIHELYSKICEEFNLPYIDTIGKFEPVIGNDKFKEVCAKYEVGTIESYQLDKLLVQRDIEKIKFLIVVKSVKNLASERSSVYRSKEELAGIMKFALADSNLKKIVVKVPVKTPEIRAIYVVCNDEPYLSSMVDAYPGYQEEGGKAYAGEGVYPYYKKLTVAKEKKKALVLAGGLPQIKLIQELQSRNYLVILADYLDRPVAKKYADKFYQESTLSIDAIQKIAISEQVDMITTCCTDQALATVAKVSNNLGLPCYINDQIGLAVTNKQYMKNIFRKNNIPTAEHKIVNAFELWKGKNYPFVVKPVDCNSSLGVVKVYSDNELKRAIENAIEYSRTKTAVIEEYIEGQEVSIDLFVENGIVKLLCTSFSEKLENRQSFVIYRGQYPAQLTYAISKKIIEIAQKIADAFSLKNCPMLMQVLVNDKGVYVVEFSARTGGCSKYHMIELASGVDVIKATVDLFEGKQPMIKPIISNKMVVNEFVYCKPGIFSHIEGLDYCKSQNFLEDSFILKSTGDAFKTLKSSGDRIAALTYVADSYEDYVEKHNRVISILKVISIDGHDMMRHDLLPII